MVDVIRVVGPIQHLPGTDGVGKGPELFVDAVDALQRVVRRHDPTRCIDRTIRKVLDFRVIIAAGSGLADQHGRLLRHAVPGRVVEVRGRPGRLQPGLGGRRHHITQIAGFEHQRRSVL